MVNFLSMFCLELQKLLKPIYNLKIKGRQFIWEEEQKVAFEEVKCTLIKPPVWHLPNSKGRFHYWKCFVSNPNQKAKLIAYASKGLPEAARNYSMMELEMCGLAINVASFAHLLKRVDFNAIVDHLNLMHIIKS